MIFFFSRKAVKNYSATTSSADFSVAGASSRIIGCAPAAKMSKFSVAICNMIRLPIALFIAETLDMEWEAHRFPINLGKRESRKFTGSDFITNHASCGRYTYRSFLCS